MIYHGVNGRVAFSPKAVGMPVSRDEAVRILEKEGFKVCQVDTLSIARSLVGRAKYRRGSMMREAPEVVDCRTIIKWAYSEAGIWLPNGLLSWCRLGELVSQVDLKQGDFVLTSDRKGKGLGSSRVGHVGLATDKNTVVHATNHVGVEEVEFDEFLRGRELVMIRRIVPDYRDLITIIVPDAQEVENSEDIEWVLASVLGFV